MFVPVAFVYHGGTEKTHPRPDTVKQCVAVFRYNYGISELPFTLFLEYDLSTNRIYLKYSMYKMLRKRIMNYLSDELKHTGLFKEFPTRLFGIDIYSQYCEFKLKSYEVKDGKFVKGKIF
jgi:hypothetical protein